MTQPGPHIPRKRISATTHGERRLSSKVEFGRKSFLFVPTVAGCMRRCWENSKWDAGNPRLPRGKDSVGGICGGGVPGRECMQCGGIWDTRLDAHVSLGARLGGAVLVVSPRGMRRRGSVRTSPSSRFRLKKWPYAPPRETTPCTWGSHTLHSTCEVQAQPLGGEWAAQGRAELISH